MLTNNNRKNFREHNLLYILKNSSNASTTWSRFKKQSITAINDLSLIAVKSPNDKLQEIFNEITLKNFLFALFLSDKSESNLKNRSPDLQLASFFVDMSISACIKEHEKWSKETPESSKLIVDHLNKAIEICKEIGYKYRLDLMKKEFVENSSKFICIWEEISMKHLDRFIKYIAKEMKTHEFIHLDWKSNNPNEKEFSIFEQIITEENLYWGKVIVSINPVSNNGKIEFYDENDKEIKTKNLVVKKYNSQTALYC